MPSRRAVTPAGLAALIAAVRAQARADPRARNWEEDAARRVLADIAVVLDEELAVREKDHGRAAAMGPSGQAVSESVRADTYRRVRDLVRDVLGDTSTPSGEHMIEHHPAPARPHHRDGRIGGGDA